MPLVDLFFSMLWFFLLIVWVWLIIKVLIDVFASDDLNGWAKAAWTIAVLLLPLIGVLVYVIARGGLMREREFRGTAHGGSFAHNVKVSSKSTADELAKLTALRDKGILSDAEYKAQKAKLLA